MKLAFVVQKIAGRSGGAERVLVETANEMARRGHQVEILSHENRGVGPFYELEHGAVHQNLFDRPIEHRDKDRRKRFEQFRNSLPDNWPLVNRYKWNLKNSEFIRDLRNYIQERSPDILIPFMPPAMIACAYAAKGLSVPIVASTHNAPEQDYQNLERWDPNPIDIKKRWQILDDMTRILVLLPDYRRWYPERLQSKIIAVPNPVQQIPKDVLGGAIRNKRALFVGRLSKVKRPQFIIHVWKQVARQFPDWKLDMYGAGPLEIEVKRLACTPYDPEINSTIDMKGVTKEIGKEYLSSSVLLHPAEYEGFPLVVCEALAHGVPVVGFRNCSGLNSLVKDGVNGVLIDGNESSTETWTRAVSQLLSDQDRLASLSMGAPETVSQYKPSAVYDQWEAALTEVFLKRNNGMLSQNM